MGDLLAKGRLGGLLLLGQNHTYAANVFWPWLDVRLGVLLNKLEGEELDVSLDGLVGELTSDETLGVEDGVLGVGGQLILGSVTNQTLALFFRECDIRWRDSVTLVIGNDFNASVLENTNTEIKSMANDSMIQLQEKPEINI